MGRLQYSRAKPEAPGSTYGAYALGVSSGIIAAALSANSEVFQFRNSHASALAVIQSLEVSAAVTTTYFAAGVPVELALFKSSAWTAAGTGGTGITPAALLKKDSAHGSTLMAAGDIRIATTGALGAGTKTLETLALSNIISGAPITSSLSGQIFPVGTSMLPGRVSDGRWPLVLRNNQGISIVSVAVPATGTWRLSVNVEWVEVTAYPY